MRKSLGDKRKQISDTQIAHITRLYGEALEVAAGPSGNWQRWYRDNIPVAERLYFEYTEENQE